MKRNSYVLLGLLLPAIFFAQCTGNKKKTENYKKSILEWRKNRMERLKQEDGWLNLAGLFWLEEGKNTIGSDPSNDIEFPEKAADKIGTVTLKDSVIYFETAEGADVKHEGERVTKIKLKTDQQKNTTRLEHSSFKWFIIDRNGKYAIRLRDLQSPLLDKLDSIPSFPVKPEWRIKAEFIPFENKTIEVPNVLGNTYEENVPGKLKFKIEGKAYELMPVGTKKSLFLIFGDDTNAEETYGGGRFLSVPEPDENNITYIDFNKAYNPPCAFTPYATCPLPPRENILPVKIKAGEKSPDIEVPHH